jgi:hypothetical protein
MGRGYKYCIISYVIGEGVSVRELIAFLIMIMLNFLIFMSQTATQSLAAEANTTAPNFGYNNSYMDSFNSGGNTLNSDYRSQLPVSNAGVLASIGAYLFPFQVLLNWLTALPGVIIAFFTAVPSFLVAMGLPSALSFAIGFVWNAAALLFLIMAVLK